MANQAITASEVLPGASGVFEEYTAGEAISAGEACFVAGNLASLADNETDIATASVRGVAMNSAASGQKVVLQTDGDWTIGATAAMAAGDVLWLSGTPGKMCPEGDIDSTDFPTFIGMCIGGNVFRLGIKSFSVAHA